jgi:hypothetical protein
VSVQSEVSRIDSPPKLYDHEADSQESFVEDLEKDLGKVLTSSQSPNTSAPNPKILFPKPIATIPIPNTSPMDKLAQAKKSISPEPSKPIRRPISLTEKLGDAESDESSSSGEDED